MAVGLNGLFNEQSFAFLAGEPLWGSTFFYYDLGKRPPDENYAYVDVAFTDSTGVGLATSGTGSFLAANFSARPFPGHPGLFTLMAQSSASRGGSYATCDESAITTGWYELFGVWTHLGSNVFSGTATLYSLGPHGTGPRVEVCHHSANTYIPKLDVSQPVYFGVAADGPSVPSLDNISIASEPSDPILRQVEIESLSKEGWLTWRSSVVPGYYGVECAEDLSAEWRPSAFWNVALTGAESSVQIPLRQGSAARLFFRVVRSQHELPLPRGAGAWDVRTDRGLVHGKVTFWEGDFMPPATGTILPVRRPIFVFEKTQVAQTVQSLSGGCFYSFVLSRLVDTTESGEDGYYQIALPPGDYSLFVLERSGDFYANELIGIGGVYYVNPVTVQANQTIVKDINITYKATF